MPEYVQRKRTKGWRMPENTVYVGRPSRWGNPFREAYSFRLWLESNRMRYWDLIPMAKAPAVAFELTLWRERILASLPGLAGKNLSCWCQDPEQCHATVLLELANGSGQ